MVGTLLNTMQVTKSQHLKFSETKGEDKNRIGGHHNKGMTATYRALESCY